MNGPNRSQESYQSLRQIINNCPNLSGYLESLNVNKHKKVLVPVFNINPTYISRWLAVKDYMFFGFWRSIGLVIQFFFSELPPRKANVQVISEH